MAKSSSQVADFPPAFMHRMETLLGEEFPAFLAALHGTPPTGLRVNTLKLNPEQFEAISPFKLAPVPWCASGFTLEQIPPGAQTPGKHPYHAAGVYYLQEPSAMAAAELLNPQPGELVLDLAAAPGGKATHLAALMQNQGLLVTNEIHPKRVWDLAENLERWGARHAVITNETPERLAAQLGGIFDRVLVDAPCSGEGLFRKNPPARSEWNPNLIQGCATRQRTILEAAAGLVKPGGRLAYTTCTFNPDENEGSLAHFLDRHLDFEIVKIESTHHSSPGRADWLEEPAPRNLAGAVRMWPHRVNGEGHFIAVLQRTGIQHYRAVDKFTPEKPGKEIGRAFEEFCVTTGLDLPADLRLSLHGSYLYHSPPEFPDLGKLQAIHPGWWLGVWKKNRFEPSHALAIGLTVNDILSRIDLSLENPAPVYAYLRGESLPLETLVNHPAGDGWSVVTVNGFPLGWAKLVQGIAKNFYPRGLRWS